MRCGLPFLATLRLATAGGGLGGFCDVSKTMIRARHARRGGIFPVGPNPDPMQLPPTILSFFAATLIAPACLFAQDQAPLETRSTPEFAMPATQGAVGMFAQQDGTLGADGHGYQAEFDARGATLVVRDPSDAEHSVAAGRRSARSRRPGLRVPEAMSRNTGTTASPSATN